MIWHRSAESLNVVDAGGPGTDEARQCGTAGLIICSGSVCVAGLPPRSTLLETEKERNQQIDEIRDLVSDGEDDRRQDFKQHFENCRSEHNDPFLQGSEVAGQTAVPNQQCKPVCRERA